MDGDTTLTGFVHGIWGDGGAVFGTKGTLDARGVLLDSNTPISFYRAEEWIRQGRSVFLRAREAEWRARKGLRQWS